jgi:hypothetical protein
MATNLKNVKANVTYATSASTANAVAGANVSGYVLNANIANTAYSVSAGNISGTINLANYATTANAVAGANVSGTVANATYSVTAGTAYSVSAANISGTINIANFATTANAVAGANVTGAVSYATTANTVAIANVSGIGNIATINKDGNSSNILYGNGVFASANASKTNGSWTLTAGTNTVSITVQAGRTYSMWVNGNVPNGIVVWNATVTLTNTNVPVIGQQFGWYYTAGNALVLTSMPSQIIGTAGSISTASPAVSNTNVFTFGITNNSGSSQTVYWGYVTLD